MVTAFAPATLFVLVEVFAVPAFGLVTAFVWVTEFVIVHPFIVPVFGLIAVFTIVPDLEMFAAFELVTAFSIVIVYSHYLQMNLTRKQFTQSRTKTILVLGR